MSANTTMQPACYPPFLAEAQYPTTGGYINGRLCAPVTIGANAGTECCLPCPLTDWIYPDNFYYLTRISGFIALVSLILCGLMLISFAVLPAEKTRRQYLNVCLIISIFIFELGFTIPVLAKPSRCYNAVTPSSDTSNVACAFSGAFVIFGGAATNMWTFVRALSMHLMVCWDITPKSRYYYGVQTLAWSVSILLLGVCMSLTGVSPRFGDYCLVNHEKAFETLWGPILGITAVTTALQLSTFVYCLHVYLRSLRAERVRNSGPTSSSSMTGFERRQNARAVYQRVKKVLLLQWRALAIVTIMIVYIVYFCIVFVLLDAESEKAFSDTQNILPWAACLIESGGDKNACLTLAKPLTVSEATLVASLVLFSVLGIQAAFLVGRRGMITGWFELFSAWWTWRSGGGDIGFSGAGGAVIIRDEPAEKELEEQRSQAQVQPSMRLGDKRTFELVRVSDYSGVTHLATRETSQRISGYGNVSSTLSSGNYGSSSTTTNGNGIGVAVADSRDDINEEEDDFAAEYWREYGNRTFTPSPPVSSPPHHREHERERKRHKKSESSGKEHWTTWSEGQDLGTQSTESLTALPPVNLWEEDKGQRETGGGGGHGAKGKGWPL